MQSFSSLQLGSSSDTFSLRIHSRAFLVSSTYELFFGHRNQELWARKIRRFLSSLKCSVSHVSQDPGTHPISSSLSYLSLRPKSCLICSTPYPDLLWSVTRNYKHIIRIYYQLVEEKLEDIVTKMPSQSQKSSKYCGAVSFLLDC